MNDSDRERIRALLAAGRPRCEIAKEVGCSASTVTRWARLLGFPDARHRPSEVDWRAVQQFYDEGRTIADCRSRFGFSYGAWDKAVSRGDLVPRRRADRKLGRSTRDRVEHLIANGLNQSEIARELRVTKSTVAYHMRSLGLRADPRFARRHDWREVQRAIDEEQLSMSQCLKRFGFGRDAWYGAVSSGRIVPNPPSMPLDQLLVSGEIAVSQLSLPNR